MELLIFFKESYTALEVQQYEEICADFFSTVPKGIGSRFLTDLEAATFRDVVEFIDADGYEDAILDDLLMLHRTGTFDHVEEDGVIIVSQLYKEFRNLMRMRLQDAVGLPYVMDALTGLSVDAVHILNSNVEIAMNVVREFNVDLVGRELYLLDGRLDPVMIRRFLRFIRKGMEDDLIMFAQSIYYYDLQTDFVFDNYEFSFQGQVFQWRKFLGTELDDRFDVTPVQEKMVVRGRGINRLVDLNPLFLIARFWDFRTICKLKYSSKKMYYYYRHRRRTEGYSDEYMVVKQRPWEGTAIGDIPGAVRYTGYKFWCDLHGDFNCDHVSLNIAKKFYNSSNVGIDELNYLLDCIESLADDEKELLKKMVTGRHFYLVFSTVCVFLRSLDRFPEMEKFLCRNNKFVRYGLILSKINASPIVIDRISKLFRFDERIYLDAMGNYDLRKKGVRKVDRLYDSTIVPRMLGKNMPFRDMEDLFTVDMGNAGGKKRSKRRRRRDRGRNRT